MIWQPYLGSFCTNTTLCNSHYFFQKANEQGGACIRIQTMLEVWPLFLNYGLKMWTVVAFMGVRYGIISFPTYLDSALPFVYNYKPANFKEDFISALTALVTAQDDPQRIKELSVGAKSILNDYQKELPKVLRQVKLNVFYIY